LDARLPILVDQVVKWRELVVERAAIHLPSLRPPVLRLRCALLTTLRSASALP
jgi:hypothetical protein